jgi:hypothetical protein
MVLVWTLALLPWTGRSLLKRHMQAGKGRDTGTPTCMATHGQLLGHVQVPSAWARPVKGQLAIIVGCVLLLTRICSSV